ncbi:MAG TPA: hypothetical protein VHO69_03270 [Phototrophicaceae bacterium]|nr:hypothetical protein [Phototrophicaceae bacterium]
MPVLLLAQGDPAAKDLLRRAIEARYGLRPPAIESLQVDFKGRARVKLGPIVTWVPVEATARFQFPTSMRWDFTVKPIGVEVQRGIEAFDGMFYRHARGNQSPQVVDEPDQIRSMQSRLWAIAALLLTPLGEHFVKLDVLDDNRLGATNTRINNSLELALRANRTLETVSLTCLNPDTNRQQRFALHLSEEQAFINDLMLPHKISAFWDNEAFFEMEPVRVESDPVVDEAVFTLA